MEGEISLFDVPFKPTVSVAQTAFIDMDTDPDAFDCCSQYRECSNTGKCVNSSEELAKHCAYRSNLENGNVFYGRNANAFSAVEYAQIIHRVNMLSPEARQALDGLLVDFYEYHRAALCVVTRNVFLEDLQSVELFDFRPLGDEFFPDDQHKKRTWNFEIVKQLVEDRFNERPDYEAAFNTAKSKRQEEIKQYDSEYNCALKEAQEREDKEKAEQLVEEKKLWDKLHPRPNSKAFLSHWLRNDAKALRDDLSAPYRLVFLPQSKRIYAEELWRDTVYKSYDDHIYRHSPLLEDGFFTSGSWKEEERRRVKLSRGYSQAEKDRRISEIDGEMERPNGKAGE